MSMRTIVSPSTPTHGQTRGVHAAAVGGISSPSSPYQSNSTLPNSPYPPPGSRSQGELQGGERSAPITELASLSSRRGSYGGPPSPKHHDPSLSPPTATVFSGPAALLAQEVEEKRRRIATMESEQLRRVREIGSQRSKESEEYSKTLTHHSMERLRERNTAQAEREEAAAMATLQVERLREASRQLQEAEKKCMDLRHSLSAEEERSRQLKRQLDDALRDNDDLKRGADRVLQGRIDGLTSLVDSKEKELESLKKEMQTAKQRTDDEREQRLQHQQTAEKLRTELSRLQVLYDDSHRERDDLLKQQQQLSERLEKESAARQEVLARHTEVEGTLERSLSGVQEQFRLRNKQLAELELKLLRTEEEAQRLLRERDSLQQEKATVQGRLDIAKEQHHAALLRTEGLEAKIAQLETHLDSHRHQTERSASEMTTLRTQLATTHQRIGLQEERIRELEVEAQRAEHLMETMQVQKAALERQHLERLQESHRLEELQQRLEGSEEQLRHAKSSFRLLGERDSELNTARKSLAVLQEKLDRASAFSEELRHRAESTDRALRHARQELQLTLAEKEAAEKRNGELVARTEAFEELLAQKETLSRKLEDSQGELQSKAEELMALGGELATLKARAGELEASEALAETLQDDNAKLLEVLRTNEGLRYEQQGLIDSLDELLRQKEEKNNELTASLEELQRRVADLDRTEQALQSCRREMAELKDRLAASVFDAEKAFQEKEMLTATQERLQQQLELSQAAKAAALAETVQLTTEIEGLQLKLGRESVVTEVAQKERDKAVKELAGVEAARDAAGVQLREQQELVVQLRGEIQAHLSNWDTATAELAETRKRLSSAQDAERQQREKAEDLSSRLSALQHNHSAAMEKAERTAILEGKVDALESVLLRKNAEVHRLEGEISDLKKQLHLADSAISSGMRTDQKLQQLREKAEALEAENAKLETELTARSKDVIAKEQNLQRETHESRLLRESLAYERERIASLETELDRLKKEVALKVQAEGRAAGLQELLNDTRAELSRRLSEVQRLQCDAMERSSLPSSDAVHDSLRRELEDYKRQQRLHVEVIAALEEEQRNKLDQYQQLQDAKSTSDLRCRAALSEADEARQALEEAKQELRDLKDRHDMYVTEGEAENRRSAIEQNKLFAFAQEYKRRLEDSTRKNGELEERLSEVQRSLSDAQSDLMRLQHSTGVHAVEMEVASVSVGDLKAQLSNVTRTLLSEREDFETVKRELELKGQHLAFLQKQLAAENALRSAEDASTSNTLHDYKAQLASLHELLTAKSNTLKRQAEELLRKEEAVAERQAEIDALKATNASLQNSLSVLRSSAEQEQSSRTISDLTAHENEIVISRQATNVARLERQLAAEHRELLQLRSKLEDAEIAARTDAERHKERETSLIIASERATRQVDLLTDEVKMLKSQLGRQQVLDAVNPFVYHTGDRRRSGDRPG